MPIGTSRTPFPSCCGATIIHGFSDAYTEAAHKPCLWKNQVFDKGHIYIVIITAGQQVKYKELLEESEFRCVSDRTENKNSGNRLYVWVRDPGKSL